MSKDSRRRSSGSTSEMRAVAQLLTAERDRAQQFESDSEASMLILSVSVEKRGLTRVASGVWRICPVLSIRQRRYDSRPPPDRRYRRRGHRFFFAKRKGLQRLLQASLRVWLQGHATVLTWRAGGRLRERTSFPAPGLRPKPRAIPGASTCRGTSARARSTPRPARSACCVPAPTVPAFSDSPRA